MVLSLQAAVVVVCLCAVKAIHPGCHNPLSYGHLFAVSIAGASAQSDWGISGLGEHRRQHDWIMDVGAATETRTRGPMTGPCTDLHWENTPIQVQFVSTVGGKSQGPHSSGSQVER